jgi:thiol-disulfide isomerase/thioredoxin
MRNFKYFLLVILWPVFNCYSQSPPTLRPLSIGDTVPDIILTNVYNYPVSKIHLSDLKGKLVILDFWSTWCGACIEGFPKMQELQKKFADQLQVILVNTYEGDDVKKVKPFFEKRKARTGQSVDLPYSLLQSSLAEYFPFKYIPHYVWINKSGRVIATTSPIEVTSERIQSVLNGSQISFHNKVDQLEFNRTEALFVNGNGGNGNDFLYRTVITNYIEGLGNGSGIQRDSTGNIVRFYMLNYQLYYMLQNAYPDVMIYPPNRTVIEVSDNTKLNINAGEGYGRYNNSFCYEIKIPPSTITELQGYMKEDFYRFFHLKVKNEERIMNCLILKKNIAPERITSKGGDGLVEIEKANEKKYIQNQPINTLIEILNGLDCTKKVILINETNITKSIDLSFPYQFPDIDIITLKIFLQQNGFLISEEKRKINVAVITDK